MLVVHRKKCKHVGTVPHSHDLFLKASSVKINAFQYSWERYRQRFDTNTPLLFPLKKLAIKKGVSTQKELSASFSNVNFVFSHIWYKVSVLIL